MIRSWINEKRIEILEEIIAMLDQGSLMGFFCGILYIIVSFGIIVLKYTICFWLWKEIVVGCCGGPELTVLEFLGLVILVKLVLDKPPEASNNTIIARLPKEEIEDLLNNGGEDK